jgi:hypothetical protein
MARLVYDTSLLSRQLVCGLPLFDDLNLLTAETSPDSRIQVQILDYHCV